MSMQARSQMKLLLRRRGYSCAAAIIYVSFWPALFSPDNLPSIHPFHVCRLSDTWGRWYVLLSPGMSGYSMLVEEKFLNVWWNVGYIFFSYWILQKIKNKKDLRKNTKASLFSTFQGQDNWKLYILEKETYIAVE